MKKRFTNHEAIRGELAARRLSKKAYRVYSEADPLSIYEVAVYDSETDENEKKYYVRGILEYDDLTFEELQEKFEAYADELDEYED